MGNARRRTGHRQRAAGWLTASWLMAALPAAIAQGPAPCAQPLGRIVSVQGAADVSRAAAAPAAVVADTPLCAGDRLVVRSRGRVAVLLNNQTVMRLDEGASLTLTEAGEPGGLQVEGLRGRLHVISRTPRRFRVTTPFLNASVDGTEFHVAATSTSSAVQVFEGVVTASNDAGSVRVSSGEQAVALARDTAPSRQLVVRPADAVVWTVHIPTLIAFDAERSVLDGPLGDIWRRAAEQVRQGRPDEAEALLVSIPPEARVPRVRIERAALLLQLGRVDAARQELGELRRLAPDSSEARALEAMIAVIENDREQALALANEAVALDPSAGAARIALSYAHQARFEIEAARDSVAAAVRQAPGHALAHARLAELELALGRLDAAMDAARRSVALDAGIAKTSTVLGFAQLARIDVAAARVSFDEAIRLDQTDPLPWLGRGLAKIRRGELAAGREDIEVAAVLDPPNSLIRSYLGKAYHEERRGPLADTQLQLAKQLDPLDPTPHLYEAIRLRALGRPGEALDSLLASVALSDNRAVYRSRQLLDQDLATRQVGLAAVFNDLLAERDATALASESLAEDPGNHSAHRFLAEAYAQRERHDIARTSELLQAQLLQPLTINPVAYEPPQADLGTMGAGGDSGVVTSDYSSMFDIEGVRVQFGVLAGNRGNWVGRSAASLLQGRFSGGVGHYSSSTDGFRPNSDIAHRMSSAFGQYALSHATSLLLDLLTRHSRYGDVALQFDPDYFSSRDRARVRQDSVRAGATHRVDTSTTWLASVARNVERTGYDFFADGFFDGQLRFVDRTTLYELQVQHRTRDWSAVAGAARSNVDSSTSLRLDYTPAFGQPCTPDVAPCEGSDSGQPRQWNVYVYTNWRIRKGMAATVGLSRDRYDDGTVAIDRWNPKLGIRVEPVPGIVVRAAGFGTVKRALVTRQTIEPTQVVGFNQFYDDVVGTMSRFRVAAVDWRGAKARAGVEVGRQSAEVSTGLLGPGLESIAPQRQRVRWARVDSTWHPSARWVLGIGARWDGFDWNATIPTDAPTYLRTARIPVRLRAFLPSGLSAEVTATWVGQRVRRLADSQVPTGSDNFVVTDFSLRYRIPERRGALGLEVRNLFNRRFSYQDDDFRNTEAQLAQYLPVRRLWMTASLAF